MVLSWLGSLVVSLVVGTLAIHVAATVVAGIEDVARAGATAVVGAFVWAVVAGLVGWLPLLGAVLGPLFALVAWILTVRALYPGDIADAAAIGAVAWLTAVVALTLVSLVSPVDAGAFGVPFV